MDTLESGDTPELSDRQAVYRCYGDGDELLYIGTSGVLGRRLASHAQKIWFLQVRKITLEWYPDETTAAAAERAAIASEQPKHNVMLKSQKLPPLPKPPPRVTRTSPVNERRAAFARALDDSRAGMATKELIKASGLGSSYVHVLLNSLLESGAIVRVERGCYRKVPGRSVAAAMRSGRPLVRASQPKHAA